MRRRNNIYSLIRYIRRFILGKKNHKKYMAKKHNNKSNNNTSIKQDKYNPINIDIVDVKERVKPIDTTNYINTLKNIKTKYTPFSNFTELFPNIKICNPILHTYNGFDEDDILNFYPYYLEFNDEDDNEIQVFQYKPNNSTYEYKIKFTIIDPFSKYYYKKTERILNERLRFYTKKNSDSNLMCFVTDKGVVGEIAFNSLFIFKKREGENEFI